MKRLPRPLRYTLLFALLGLLLGIGAITASYLYLAPQLPDATTLRDVRFQVPLRVYTRDEKLIAEFGEMRRTPLAYEQFPTAMVQAVLAAEDDRFFEHPGVDYQGLLRAAWELVRTGQKGQGGSTITMQVARNFFLSREKTYSRKLKEIYLSLKMEDLLGKEEILSLYLNKIFLGHRAYGVAAAAQVYYGKELAELELPQFAMIAGLPKAPSRYNPIANPERALLRRNYVLRRMHELGFIDREAYNEARNAPVTAGLHRQDSEVEAPYLAEMVRAEIVERCGEERAYAGGLKVYTTVEARLQKAANKALRNALLDYNRRHGYRGPEAHVALPEDGDEEQWQQALKPYRPLGGLVPALVVAVGERSALAYRQGGDLQWLDLDDHAWAKPYLDDNHTAPAPSSMGELLAVGDIVRLEQGEAGQWQLSQIPEVAGALVSLSPRNGALQALSGGFDYSISKFNRVTQAERQPGSNFKPFIYSAALDKGFTAASIINDAPVVFEDDKLESSWRPENYSGRFFGPTRLREALVRSRNLVSIRILRALGLGYALNYTANFGFDKEHLPRDLSLALGSATLTPLELVRGYSVFANGGYLIEPYFIERIEDADGNVLWKADPLIACPECEKQLAIEAENVAEQGELIEAVSDEADDELSAALDEAEAAERGENPPRLAPRSLDERNVYLMTTMMQDVVRRGTGRRALSLGRHDLAGKTGTTNEQRDAWFSGFNREVVTTAWVGFDNPRPLGNRETGARAALPMWIEYMAVALDGVPEQPLEQPPGITSARIDPETGEFAGSENPEAIFEMFRTENVPQEPELKTVEQENGNGNNLTEQLF